MGNLLGKGSAGFAGAFFTMPRSLSITSGACILWALMVLVLPLNWLMAVAVAALWHEFCHSMAAMALGCRIYTLHFHGGGIRMEMAPMTAFQELLCALAGPAGSFLLSVFYPLFPRAALCALVQGLYNLIPVHPLDGGRALSCASQLFFPGKAEWLCRWAEYVSAGVMFCFGLWTAFAWNLGIAPVLFALHLPGKIFLRKNSLHWGQTSGTIVLP